MPACLPARRPARPPAGLPARPAGRTPPGCAPSLAGCSAAIRRQSRRGRETHQPPLVRPAATVRPSRQRCGCARLMTRRGHRYLSRTSTLPPTPISICQFVELMQQSQTRARTRSGRRLPHGHRAAAPCVVAWDSMVQYSVVCYSILYNIILYYIIYCSIV